MHWLNDNESLPQYRPNRPHILRIGHASGARRQRRDLRQRRSHRSLRRRVVPRPRHRRQPGQHPRLGHRRGEPPDRLEVALGTPLRAILDAGRRRSRSPGAAARRLRRRLARRGAPRRRLLQRGPQAATACRRRRRRRRHARRRRAASSRPSASCAGWPTRARASADPAPSVCPRSPRTSPTSLHRSRDPQGASSASSERCGVIEGRGACRHPDGVMRLVRSALEVFADDFERPRQGCGLRRVAGRSATYWVTCRRSSARRSSYGSEAPRRALSSCGSNPILCDGFGHCARTGARTGEDRRVGLSDHRHRAGAASNTGAYESARYAERGCPRQALHIHRISEKKPSRSTLARGPATSHAARKPATHSSVPSDDARCARVLIGRRGALGGRRNLVVRTSHGITNQEAP